MKWSVTRRLAILTVADFILRSLGKQCLCALTDFILTWRSPLYNNNARHSLLSCDFFQWVQSDSVMDFLCSGIFNYPCRSCFSWTGRCSKTMLQSWVHKNRNHKAKENIAFLLHGQCDLLSRGVWLCIDTFFIQKRDRRLICPQWDMNLYYCKFISPSCNLPTVCPLWATTQNCEDEMKVKDFSTIKNSGHLRLMQRKLGLWNGLKWKVHTLVIEHKVQQDQRKEQIFHHMSQLFCSCISSSFLKSDDRFNHYFKTVASLHLCKKYCSNNIYHQTVKCQFLSLDPLLPKSWIISHDKTGFKC